MRIVVTGGTGVLGRAVAANARSLGHEVITVSRREVAAHLVAIAARPPAQRLPDFAGPEVRPFAEFAAEWRRATHRRRLVVPLPLVGRVAHWLRAGGLCNRSAAVGRTTFAQWLRDHGPGDGPAAFRRAESRSRGE